jgi:hypothetical protein
VDEAGDNAADCRLAAPRGADRRDEALLLRERATEDSPAQGAGHLTKAAQGRNRLWTGAGGDKTGRRGAFHAERF